MSATNMNIELLDDRYELGEVIGKGGMGEVRRAHDTRLGRDVAIKFLRPDLAAQPEVRARFADEARHAGQLTHPNVVTVYDSGEHDGQSYIVMESLPGRTLRDEIAKGPLPESFAREVGVDVLAGLEAAHAAGIVHRDVAPSNILLTNDGRAKIADFGIAKAGEGLSTTMAGQVMGTPAYLSPDRLQGAAALPADDVYALGVVLYEAVTGGRLFAGSTPIAIAQTILNSPPPPLRETRPDLSPGFVAAVDGAMAREPAERLMTADAMRTAFDGNGLDETMMVGAAAIAVEPAGSTTTMPTFADPTPIPIAAPLAAGAVAPWWDTIRSHEIFRRTPREVWIAVAAIVFIGLLLLALTRRDVATDPVNATDQPATTVPVPTTLAPPPTTQVTAAPAVNPNVNGGGGKGKGHKDD